jgi:hypothetical protein
LSGLDFEMILEDVFLLLTHDKEENSKNSGDNDDGEANENNNNRRTPVITMMGKQTRTRTIGRDWSRHDRSLKRNRFAGMEGIMDVVTCLGTDKRRRYTLRNQRGCSYQNLDNSVRSAND